MLNILNALAHDYQTIPYRKELNSITGSVLATILLQQCIYWWHKNKEQPFYKFIEPSPDHEKYNDGDSWTEELGFTKYEFRTAYKKLEELDIISKKINMQRVTYYTLNATNLAKLIMSTYESGKNQLTKVDNINIDLTENTTENTTDIIKKKSFKFTLHAKLSFDKLTDNYKEKLEQEINKINGNLKFDEFVLGLESGGYKYKNFLSAYKAWNKKQDRPKPVKEKNEKSDYNWDFKKAKETSDKIKNWLDFDLGIDWLNENYLKDIPIKGKNWAIGWQDVKHPYLDKEEILLYKIGNPESLFLENNKSDDVLDVEVIENE